MEIQLDLNHRISEYGIKNEVSIHCLIVLYLIVAWYYYSLLLIELVPCIIHHDNYNCIGYYRGTKKEIVHSSKSQYTSE